MENKIDFFESGDYKFVMNLINEKIDATQRAIEEKRAQSQQNKRK